MGLRDWVLNWLLQDTSTEYQDRRERVELTRDYREGRQRKQIKVKPLQPDDNLTINFCSLIMDRTVSLLFGDGIGFDMGEDEAKQGYIDEVMEANRQEILFHRAGMLGAESGDCYIKIIPDGIEGNGKKLPRLVVLDPMWMEMETDVQDFEKVTAYNIRYNVMEGDREVAYWERTQHTGAPIVAKKQTIRAAERDMDGNLVIDTETWEVVLMRSNRSGAWEIVKTDPWAYNFPPIVHWQNLPNPCSPYGQPDLTDDVIRLQDSINFTASNIRKVIRLHGHPILVGLGFGAQQIDVAPDKVVKVPAGGDFKSVEMLSDLSPDNAFLLMQRQALFDITRTVDISSMSDKLGALTNFGLRVLYGDALFKLGTKRELYGDGIEELVRRILALAGMGEEDVCTIVWPDMLPVNDLEALNTQRGEIELGIKSRATVASERGIDYEKEQELLAGEQVKQTGIGDELMKMFEQGR